MALLEGKPMISDILFIIRDKLDDRYLLLSLTNLEIAGSLKGLDQHFPL